MQYYYTQTPIQAIMYIVSTQLSKKNKARHRRRNKEYLVDPSPWPHTPSRISINTTNPANSTTQTTRFDVVKETKLISQPTPHSFESKDRH